MAFVNLAASSTTLKDALLPGIAGIENAVNTQLAGILNKYIVGVEIVAQDKGRRNGKELAVQVSYDSVSASAVTLTKPFQMITFQGTTIQAVSASADAWRAANPGFFHAAPFIKYINGLGPTNNPFIAFQFYCEDPNGVDNWVMASSLSGLTTGVTVIGASPLTSSGVNRGWRAGNTPAIDIYDDIYPGVTHHGTLRGVLDIPDGSTIVNGAAVEGIIDVDDATTHGVALFGLGRVKRDNGQLWGINTLLQDAETRAVHADIGKVVTGAELDFNIMSVGTEVIGVSVGGNSLSQPTQANAFIANSLGTGIKWVTGFYSMDGAVEHALVAGPVAAAGTDIDSQDIWFQFLDGAGTKRKVTAFVDAFGGDAFLTLSCDIADFFLKLAYGDLLMDDRKAIKFNGSAALWGDAGVDKVYIAAPAGDSVVIQAGILEMLTVSETFYAFRDGIPLILGTIVGNQIGNTAAQKLSFWGAVPIVQPAAATQAALNNSTGGAYDAVLQAIAGSGADAAINNNFTDLWTLQNAIRAALVAAGIMKGSA